MQEVFYHPESDCFYTATPSEREFLQGCYPVDPSSLPYGTQIRTGLGVSTVVASMDFETYSEAGFEIDRQTGKVRGIGSQGKGGLPVVGTPVYSAHPSAEVLCLFYDLKDGKGRRGWLPGMPSPADLLQHIADGKLVEAWNVTFEFYIWNMICARRYGWPALHLEQCRCVMARSRRFSLPGSLGIAAKVLGTPQKDADGGRLINKLTRPHSPTKKRPAHRWTRATAPEDFDRLFTYCDRDVEAEDHAAARIPDLTPAEFEAWQVDQRINARGVQVDVAALDAMLDILGQAERRYTLELGQITQGAVGSVAEVAKLGAWLAENGLHVPDLQKDTVEEYVTDETRERFGFNVWRALQIRQLLGAANVKKLRTLKIQVSSDGRLRDQYTYCGADRTGRASAGGVQLQNITSKGPKSAECESCGEFFHPRDAQGAVREACPFCGSFMYHVASDWTVEAVESALRVIASRDLDYLVYIWGDPVTLLCGCLRGLFIARDGCELICVDFSAIEAVVAACLSRCQWRIAVFSGHGKIYEESAAKATGITFEEIIEHKKKTGQHHPARKTIGKVRELAGGYGGWVGAWKNFGADEFMSDDEIKADVLKWREESPEIVEAWGGQFRQVGPGVRDCVRELYGLEGCAIKAILSPGHCFAHIDITYAVYDDVLYCRLPSGRFLHYHRPRSQTIEDRLGRGPCYQITFEGYNSNSTKGPVGWHRMETYGGRLFENVVQAVAADIQFGALARLEARGYPVVMHTHDEGVAEVPVGFGSVEEVAEIMTERPAWASWWPLRAAGWRHKRYQKD